MKLLAAIALLCFALVARAQSADTAVSANVGQQVTFSVTVATGTPPLSYQWMKNGTPIPNATLNPFVLTANAQVVDSGSYTVQVSNSAGFTVSNNCVLTVKVPVVPPAGAVATGTAK